ATAAAAPGDRAPVRRPGGLFLERLSHLPRPGHRGPDVARRPALLRSPSTPTAGPVLLRSSSPRPRQGKEATLPAPARRHSPGPTKLLASGTTFDQLARSVCFSQRPPARTRHDRRRTALF